MANLFPDRPPDLNQQIACVKREIRMRGKVYPQWVDRGKMRPEQSVYELNVMGAVLKTLENLRDAEKAKTNS